MDCQFPNSGNVIECLICLTTIPYDESNYVAQVSEILSDLFEVLCKYMEWSPPLRYQFNFNNDIFPFCKECRSTVVTLYKSHQLFTDVQKQINTVISKLSAKILLSKKDKNAFKIGNKFTGSSQTDSLSEDVLQRRDEKVTYYRDLVDSRYSASVRVTAYAQPLVASPKIANDKRAPEERIVINEEGYCNSDVTGPDAAETKAEGVSDQEAKEGENTDNPGNVKRRCCEGSELLTVNNRRVSLRNLLKKNKQEKSRTQLLSNYREASSEIDQIEDSDDERSIVSRQNEHLNNDEIFKVIAEPCVNGVKVHDQFKHGCEPSSKRRNKARKESDSASDSTDSIKEDADLSDYENVSQMIGPGELVKTGHNSSEHRRDLMVKSNDRFEAKNNGSQAVSISSVALEAEEVTNPINLNVTALPPCVNPLNQESVQNEAPSEGMGIHVADGAVQICVESNIFHRPEFKNRIQKVGPSEYLLDNKISFEFINNKWRCIPCDLEYVQKGGLRRHFDYCPGKPPTDSVETLKFELWFYDKLKSGKYQCRHCKQISSSNKDAIVHLKRRHKGRRKEPVCVELELNKFLCNNKYPFELTNDQFKCGACLANFAKKGEILDHIRSKHILDPEKKWMTVKITPQDKFVVNEKFSFEKIGDEYRCCDCIYTSLRMDLMKNHMRQRHIKFGKFLCGTCGQKFDTHAKLWSHKESHITERTSVCEICGKSYKSEKGLQLHKDTVHLDSSKKPFACTVCGKAFRIQGLLNFHRKIHERAMCDICGKNFSVSTFKEHVASHSKIKNHECKKCGKRYLRSASLYVHLKNHDGVKPYSCDICGMKFTQQYSVTRHKNVAHNPNGSTKTSRKRKHKKVSSEDDDTDEEKTDEEDLPDEEVIDGENDSSKETSEEEET